MPQALRRSLSVATATAVAASALVALGGAGVANAAADHPTINEFSIDTAGVDVEYVEIHAAPGTDLAGHSLTVLRGDVRNAANPGRVYLSRALTGTTDANGLLVVPLPADAVVNDSVTLLLVDGPTLSTTTDLDSDNDGVLDVGVSLDVVDSVAVLDTGTGHRAYSDEVLTNAFDGGTQRVGGASRLPDGADDVTSWVRNSYTGYGLETPPVAEPTIAEGQAINTPGAPNAIFEGGEEPPVEPEPGVCDAVATPIGAVQGTGDATPFAGQVVTVEGVITAVLPGLRGVAIQSLVGQEDADPATSEGVFVFSDTAAATLAVGNHVQITGTASERFGQTQISATQLAECAESVTVPDATELTLPLAAPEATEGMLVTFPADLTILETFNFARYGELALGTGLQYQPTDVLEPGSAEAVALLEENLANRILLDDAVTAQNADPARHPNGQPYTLDNRFRAGDLVTGATGILGYDFDQWRIQPTVGATVTTVNERPEVPEVGGDLQVAAFNVLNYFTTLGDRGAQTAQELQRQQDKLVAAILAMDADIVGLMEIENGGTALTTLVAAINAAAGTDLYSAIETGPVGTDAIATAIIYQADAVTPEGASAALDETIDPRFDTAFNRPAITQSFAVAGTDEVLTISVNHLKSKGSDCDAVGDPIDPDGQGNCNGVRTEAATALAEWLATDPTDSGSPHSMIIGDINSYAMEDPIVAIESAGYVDLLPVHDGPGEYTYTFDGMLGSLDHALASESLAAQVVDAAAWHTNTDEVSLIDYSMQFKQPAQDAIYAPDPFRASDHDAVLVGIAFDPIVDPGVEVTTFAGADRYETNAQASAALFEAGTDVYLASGQGFVDALAAGPAAAVEGASLLLTPTDRILPVTAAEIERLQPQTITIVGGEPSVSAAVEARLAELAPDATVERIAGADRFETAALLATDSFGSADGAFIASGVQFADALSASGAAAMRGDAPVLLSRPDVLPAVTAAAIEELGVSDVIVLGGRETLADSVVRDARELADVVRLAGSDRYATNALVVQLFAVPTPEQAIVVASGANFPDALSATAASGVLGAPLLLSPGQCVLLDTEDVITALDPSLVVNLGGRPTLESDAWQTAC